MLKDQLFKTSRLQFDNCFSGPKSSRDFLETGPRLRYINSIGLVKKKSHTKTMICFACTGRDLQLFYFQYQVNDVGVTSQSGVGENRFLLNAFVWWN